MCCATRKANGELMDSMELSDLLPEKIWKLGRDEIADYELEYVKFLTFVPEMLNSEGLGLEMIS
jgi:hypothetical protein